jgi:hypothetical protein
LRAWAWNIGGGGGGQRSERAGAAWVCVIALPAVAAEVGVGRSLCYPPRALLVCLRRRVVFAYLSLYSVAMVPVCVQI